MLTLGQKLNTIDVGKTLHGESGHFEATSPTGERYKIECRPHNSITSFVSIDNPGQWQLEKVSELAQDHENRQQPQRARAAGSGG